MKIDDISKDIHGIIYESVKEEELPVLCPIVIRGLKALSRHLEVIDKVDKIIKNTLLDKITKKDPDVDQYQKMKDEVVEKKLAVMKEIDDVEKLYQEDISQPDYYQPVSVPELLEKLVKLEAKILKLKPVLSEAMEKLDKLEDHKLSVEEAVKKQKLLYGAISQGLGIQTDIDKLSQSLHDKRPELPQDDSVTDVLKILKRKQKDHIKMIKHLEYKIKGKADLDLDLLPALKELQKIKDKAQRQELKIEDIKKEHRKTLKQTDSDIHFHSARSTLPLRSLNKPLKASVCIDYGPEDSKKKHLEVLLLGQKSLDQLYWEKDQSLPDRQDQLVSSYHQDKLITDDRTALGYTHIKEELNTYRHLHILCSYEDSLPASVRLLAWKSHELVKLLYYRKVTLVMPDKTNFPNNLDITIDIKKDDRMLDMEIRTPYETNIFKHVEEPSVCKMIAIPKIQLIKESILHTMTGTSPEAICQVSKDRIKSLEGTRYELMKDTKSCEHVLAMDCSSTDKIVVTSKLVHSLTDKKMLKIMTPDHKVEILPLESGIEVKVDEVKKDLREPDIVKGKMSVHKLYDGSVEVRVPEIGVYVTTDGIKTSVKVSKVLTPRLCGLCGELTHGQGTDLMDPHQVALDQPEALVSTYLLPDMVCDAKALQEKYQVCKIRKIAKQVSPVEKTKILDLEDKKICFSTHPVMQCPSNSKPDGIKSVQVSFHCLDPSDSQVPVYKELAKKQVIRELQYKTVSIQTYVPVPVDCVTE
jgi:hypothetical protein